MDFLECKLFMLSKGDYMEIPGKENENLLMVTRKAGGGYALNGIPLSNLWARTVIGTGCGTPSASTIRHVISQGHI